MKTLAIFVCVFFLSNELTAQNTPALPLRVADFSITPQESGYKFSPILPVTAQIAGAPEVYWTYLWEFGDGDKSTQKNPIHTYTNPGEFIVTLDATAHYDTGKKPTRKKSKLVNPKREALTAVEYEDVFDHSANQAIAMATPANPRAGEELSFILSYRNKSSLPINGTLHLFFNEKKFPTPHFKFLESRPCFGEVEAPLYSAIDPAAQTLPWADWSAVGILLPTQLLAAFHESQFPTPSILLDARGKFREERAWKFENLEANAKRNFFFSLEGLASMVKEVNTIIHVQAIYVPDNPAVPAEPYLLELEIVASHDPNVIAVSDNRLNYRGIDEKKIDYKIRFQNNGEGPANTVQVQVEIPEGLNMKKIKPQDWAPKCPICPKTPTKNSCLDTLSTKNGFLFTFRNIYLPGSRQADVVNLDSTQGFIKYRIEADRNMPKFTFRSRARIVFDHNTPIFTNYTHTRFKTGISPGIKVGWNVEPGAAKSGFYFIGASISPYKSWRFYPQIEWLSGLKARQNLPDMQFQSLTITGNNGTIFKDTTILTTNIRSQRGFVSFEVPVSIRRSINKRLGFGLGLASRIYLENGETSIETNQSTIHWTDSATGFIKETIQGESTKKVEAYKHTRYDFMAFGDLNLGSVRAGPSLGIRAGAMLAERKLPKIFVQLSVEVKL